MTELVKATRACFVGGTVCCGIAFLVAPAFWWVGIVVGIFAGYLAYEFREVIQAVPPAIAAARACAPEAANAVKTWWHKPHPFIVLPILISPIVMALFLLYAYSVDPNHPFLHFSAYRIDTFLLCYGIAWLLGYCIIGLFVQKGEDMKKVIIPGHERTFSEWKERDGYRQIELTYRNVCFYALVGAWGYLRILLWLICSPLIILWLIIKFVHSDKRLLCGVEGALGGAVAYWILAAPTMTLSQTIMVIFAGGVLGAVIGVIHWAFFQHLSTRFLSDA